MKTTLISNSNTLLIGDEIIDNLKNLASDSVLRRSRFCLHKNHDDKVQDMVIVICYDCYIPPHRQLKKKKSYKIIDGAMAVFFFDDNGNIVRKKKIGVIGSQHPFIISFTSSEWHTILPLSDFVIYMETTSGPYIKEQTEFASWAPTNDDSEDQVLKFLQNLKDY